MEPGKPPVTDRFGNEFPMYDLEKMIAESVRNQSKFEIREFAMALKTYAGMSDKRLDVLVLTGGMVTPINLR